MTSEQNTHATFNAVRDLRGRVDSATSAVERRLGLLLSLTCLLIATSLSTLFMTCVILWKLYE